MSEDRRRDATEHTIAANAKLLEALPFDDARDFEEAMRGFIAPLSQPQVAGVVEGFQIWDTDRHSFVEEGSEAPPTVNPSLWRQAQLCIKGGLFEVADRIYQVRNQDVSNLTVVEGDTGLIVIDPLISPECARAALDLYFEHRPRRDVVAVIHSHSHVDHYGGVKGIVDERDVEAGKVRIIAPEGFLDAVASENVLAGNAMSRRAVYQFGVMLPADPKGHVGLGLGMGVSLGVPTLIPPTEEITETGQKLEIDGLTFEFLLAPETEAPAEMHWFIEELGALTAAENCTHTLHNTYALRGVPIRDPRAWSRYLNETIDRWGERSEVMYGMHHWPVWGTERVLEMLRNGRDAYRYINDETLRLANHGHTADEIAEIVRLPDDLERHWALRSYYGTVSHNVKSTYVRYLGWYDGNPAHLDNLPPVEASRRYVELMGGADEVLAAAGEAFERGEYRWVAELVNHVVFGDPGNAAARELAASAHEQLGYQSESATWRNSYLMAAQELRQGSLDLPGGGTGSPDTVKAMPLELLFDYLAVRLNGPKAAGKRITLNFVFTDSGERAALELANGSLHASLGGTDDAADATITLTRPSLDSLVLGEKTLLAEAESGEVHVEPDTSALAELLELLDDFHVWFRIIEP